MNLDQTPKDMRAWMRAMEKRVLQLERRRVTPSSASNVYTAEVEVVFSGGAATVGFPGLMPRRALVFANFAEVAAAVGATVSGDDISIQAGVPDGTYTVYLLFAVP